MNAIEEIRTRLCRFGAESVTTGRRGAAAAYGDARCSITASKTFR
jgi:hypothetical protein